jgi:hypothetical protein
LRLPPPDSTARGTEASGASVDTTKSPKVVADRDTMSVLREDVEIPRDGEGDAGATSGPEAERPADPGDVVLPGAPADSVSAESTGSREPGSDSSARPEGASWALTAPFSHPPSATASAVDLPRPGACTPGESRFRCEGLQAVAGAVTARPFESAEAGGAAECPPVKQVERA